MYFFQGKGFEGDLIHSGHSGPVFQSRGCWSLFRHREAIIGVQDSHRDMGLAEARLHSFFDMSLAGDSGSVVSVDSW